MFELAIRARSDRPDVRGHSAGAQIFEKTVRYFSLRIRYPRHSGADLP
jgi:hypothetical protein